MQLWVLVENTSDCEELSCEHGLSLYIRTRRHELLFDMGQGELFLENARKMNLDIGGVDTAVLSHGHYDHGGGIPVFLEHNAAADVYVGKHAFEEHLGTEPDGSFRYIGIEQDLKNHPRIVPTENYVKLDEELTLFSGVSGEECVSPANSQLKVKTRKGVVQDDFCHEQNLIITQDGRDYLFSGCAHAGIVNIVKACCALQGRAPYAVVGGFHLCMYDAPGDGKLVEDMASRLLEYPAKYYTGHCTGTSGYDALHALMGGRIERIATGRHFGL